jgi:hypothetical protein
MAGYGSAFPAFREEFRNFDSNMQKLRTILIAVVLLASVLIPENAHAGDKTRQLLRNVVRISGKTILVPQILPDTFFISRLQKKKKSDEKIAEYLMQVRQANENLRQYMDEIFDFAPYEFITYDPASGKSYPEMLEEYDPLKYVVLQTGIQVQFAKRPPRKLGNYYTRVLGIYETDGTTSMFLVPARPDIFHRKDIALTNITKLNEQLHRNLEKARRKGIRPKKEPLSSQKGSDTDP